MLERNEPLTKKDMLEFIRAHREALNEKTVKASPQEEGQYLPEMQMWNAIEAQVREMTAVEFLNARDEMTAGTHKDRVRVMESIFQSGHNNELAVEIVKKWKEEQDGH